MKRVEYAVLFLLLAAVWGTAYVVTSVGLRTVSPTFLAALRFDVAALVLFGYVVLRGAEWRPRGSAWYPIIAGGTLLIAVTNGFLFAGQRHVTSAVAAVIVGLVPVVTPALSRLVSTGERLSPFGMTGVLIGFVGVAVIADLDPTNLVTGGHGVALVLVSALAWALGTVLLYDRTPTLSLPAEGAWMMLVGAVLLHAASFVQREPLPAVLTLEIVAVVGYLAAVSGVGGYLLYLFLLDALGPIEVSLLEYVIPLFAALVGWFALGELLSTSTVVGFGLIVVGFFIVKRSALLAELRRRQNHRKRPRIE